MPFCPSPETLARLAHEPNDGPRFLAAEAHVEDCADCQAILERIAADASSRGLEGRSSGPADGPPPTVPGFVIEREIGRGGMGVVYQAWQPHLGRRVAIKVVGRGHAGGDHERRRWLREARTIGRVRHPNIVRLHEAGEIDRCRYLVLDLIPGGSLADRADGPLPARSAAGLVEAVALAVEALHREGIVHLDIKPSNILLDGPPGADWDRLVPMITDFGIARAGDDPGVTDDGAGGFRGTPSSMAPEQIAGDPAAVGPSADVFALGATLYGLLTGRPPFQAATVIETLDLIRTREPAPPRSLVPGLSRDLETIVLTCLRKDPRRRYPSAEAFADDLRRWLDGFPIRARPTPPHEHAARWCFREPALASVFAALALTVAVSLAGLLTLWRQAEHARARAVESERSANAVVDDLVSLVAENTASPHLSSSERIDLSAHAVLELAASLRRAPGTGGPSIFAICRLERSLALQSRRRGRFTDARTLLVDSIRWLEARPDAAAEHARSLADLATVCSEEGRAAEASALIDRAERAVATIEPVAQPLDVMTAIVSVRRGIALSSGRPDLLHRAFEEELRLYRVLGGPGNPGPEIALLKAIAMADRPGDGAGLATIREAIWAFPPGAGLPEMLQVRLGEWIAHDLDASLPAGLDGRGLTDRPDPDAFAAEVFNAIEARGRTLGLHPSLLPFAASRVASMASAGGVDPRRAGRLDQARWIAAWLSAFAARLARLDPADPRYHLIRSEAFAQQSKNAWKTGDFPAIEAAMRSALGEASAALRLDPASVQARIQVANYQDRLLGLAAGGRSPR